MRNEKRETRNELKQVQLKNDQLAAANLRPIARTLVHGIAASRLLAPVCPIPRHSSLITHHIFLLISFSLAAAAAIVSGRLAKQKRTIPD